MQASGAFGRPWELRVLSSESLRTDSRRKINFPAGIEQLPRHSIIDLGAARNRPIPRHCDVGAPSRVFEVVSMLPLLFVVPVQRGENAAAGLLVLSPSLNLFALITNQLKDK